MIEVRVSGPNAGALADEVATFLAEVGAAVPVRSTEEAARKGEGLDVATLIVSLPSAILAADDLARRFQLAKRIDRLLAWLKANAGAEDRVRLQIAGVPRLELTEAGQDSVLEALAAAGTPPAAPHGRG